MKPRASLFKLAGAARDAAVPLVIPVIIMGGILTGWFTPTEAGLVAVVYILAGGDPGANCRHIRELPLDFAKAGLLYSIPLITVAAASAFGWMLAYLRGPDLVSDWITSLPAPIRRPSCSCWSVAFVIIGDFVDAIPAIIIFMPIINKLTEIGDINPVHMGVVIIVTLAFGLITPPYGIALLMASKFVEVGFGRRWCARCRSTSCSSLTIAFCIVFPDIVLWLPKQFLPESVGCFKAPAGSGFICPP